MQHRHRKYIYKKMGEREGEEIQFYLPVLVFRPGTTLNLLTMVVLWSCRGMKSTWAIFGFRMARGQQNQISIPPSNFPNFCWFLSCFLSPFLPFQGVEYSPILFFFFLLLRVTDITYRYWARSGASQLLPTWRDLPEFCRVSLLAF